MRRITAGNDAPFRWAVTLQGKPLDLTGKDVKVYVINSRGEIPVAQLTIEGHEVSGVFEGRYQTRLGEHSLVLHVNEGRPEMKTAAVANVFELVQWSADAGGSDEGDVIVAPVLIESELSIGMGGGSSYDDTELREAIEALDNRVAAHSEDIVNLQENKADKSELTELSAEVGKKQDTIIDLETIRSGASKGATAIQEVKTINGQSIVGEGDIIIQGGGGGGMSTPSGDPMHYMFEAAGALYNATGSDITRIGMFDEEITHKAGYWYLNELGDITTEEMRAIYVNWRTNMSWGVYMGVNNIRTNLPFLSMTWNGIYYKPTETGAGQVFQNATMKAVSVFWPSIFNGAGTLNEMFNYMYQLDTIIGELSAATYGKTCFNAQNLRKLKVKKLKSDIYFNECKKLSKESVLYMIQNSAATSSITITLHKDVYDKLVEDADIVAALEGKNITLGLPA